MHHNFHCNENVDFQLDMHSQSHLEYVDAGLPFHRFFQTNHKCVCDPIRFSNVAFLDLLISKILYFSFAH